MYPGQSGRNETINFPIWEKLRRIDSVCSQPCKPYQKREVNVLQSCCWSCSTCSPTETVNKSICMEALENELWNFWSPAVRKSCKFSLPEHQPNPGPGPSPPVGPLNSTRPPVWRFAQNKRFIETVSSDFNEAPWLFDTFGSNSSAEVLLTPLSDTCEACPKLHRSDENRTKCEAFVDKTIGYTYWFVLLILSTSATGSYSKWPTADTEFVSLSSKS